MLIIAHFVLICAKTMLITVLNCAEIAQNCADCAILRPLCGRIMQNHTQI